MVHFKDITLGRASAELEGAYHPELIVDGFLDPWTLWGGRATAPSFYSLDTKVPENQLSENIFDLQQRTITIYLLHIHSCPTFRMAISQKL